MRIYGVMNLFSRSVSSTLLPTFSNLVVGSQPGQHLPRSSRKIIERHDRFISRLILSAAIVISLWMEHLLEVFLQSPPLEARITAQILICMPVVAAHNHVWIYGLIATGYIRIVRQIQFQSLSVSVILCTALGWVYGSIGFALGFLIGVCFASAKFSKEIPLLIDITKVTEGDRAFRIAKRTTTSLRRNIILYVGFILIATCGVMTSLSLFLALAFTLTIFGLMVRELFRFTRVD